MSNKLISQLKKMKTYNGRINPDQVWVDKNRETMLRQISSDSLREEKTGFSLDMIWQGMSIFIPTRFVYAVVRPLFVFLVVGAVATSGWIASVSATESCLPGDMCYGVKMAVEKTQEMVLVVTGSDEEDTQLHLEFASRRAKEIKTVVQKKDDEKAPEKAQVAIDKLEKSLHSASESVKKVGENNPEKLLEVSKNVKQKTTEINQALQVAEENNEEVNVTEAKKLSKDASLSVVESLVQNKVEGKVLVSDEEVKDIVNNEINEVVDSASTTVAKVNNLLPSGVITTTATTTAVATTTQAVVDEVVKTVDETGVQIQKDLTVAKDLVENNQLLEAIQKVKEVSLVTTEVEKVVKEAKRTVAEASDEATTAETETKTEVEVGEDITTTTVSSTIPSAVMASSTVISTSTEVESVATSTLMTTTNEATSIDL